MGCNEALATVMLITADVIWDWLKIFYTKLWSFSFKKYNKTVAKAPLQPLGQG